MPEHGRVIWLNTPENNAILQGNVVNGWSGRLSVSASPGADTYYVKLIETYPVPGEVLGVTVTGGGTVDVDVPLDGSSDQATYELRYAAGTSWYGEEFLFGPAGSYARADSDFTFSQGTWWEVDLVLIRGGNLEATGLDYEDF